MELAFAIPFIEIPVPGFGKEAPNPQGQPGHKKDSLVDINLGALVSAGILASAALIFTPQHFEGFGYLIKGARNLDSGESGMSNVLARIDEKLLTHDIDTTVCTQRAMCWLVKSASSKVLQGQGGSVDKIIDGITSNSWLRSLVNGTAIQDALDVGRRNENCNTKYTKCHINENRIQRALMYFMKEE